MKRLALLALALAGCSGLGLQPGRLYRVEPRLAEGPRDRAASDQERARAPLPALEAPAPSAAIPPVERRLSSGVRVLVAKRTTFPVATVIFVIGRRTADDTAVAELYGGAVQRPLWGLEDGSSVLAGATGGWGTDVDAIYVRLTTVGTRLLPALAAVAPRLASVPVFVGWVSDAKLVKSTESDGPDRAAIRASNLAAFPTSRRHAQPPRTLTREARDAVKPRDLLAFGEEHLAPENFQVVVTGDVDVDAVVATLDRGLAGLPRRALVADRSAVEGARCDGIFEVIERSRATQASFAITYPLPPLRQTRDGAALSVLASAIGKSLSSRLNVTIRQELGATYGVHARANLYREAGAFEVSASVDDARAAEIVARVLEEIENDAKTPLSDEELLAARLRARMPDDEDAMLLADLAASDEPTSAIAKRRALLASVTAEDVRDAAQRYLSRARACGALVGADRSRLGESLRARGITTR